MGTTKRARAYGPPPMGTPPPDARPLVEGCIAFCRGNESAGIWLALALLGPDPALCDLAGRLARHAVLEEQIAALVRKEG